MRQVQESYKAEYGVYIVFSVRRIPLYVLCNHTLGAGKKEKIRIFLRTFDLIEPEIFDVVPMGVAT